MAPPTLLSAHTRTRVTRCVKTTGSQPAQQRRHPDTTAAAVLSPPPPLRSQDILEKVSVEMAGGAQDRLRGFVDRSQKATEERASVHGKQLRFSRPSDK